MSSAFPSAHLECESAAVLPSRDGRTDRVDCGPLAPTEGLVKNKQAVLEGNIIVSMSSHTSRFTCLRLYVLDKDTHAHTHLPIWRIVQSVCTSPRRVLCYKSVHSLTHTPRTFRNQLLCRTHHIDDRFWCFQRTMTGCRREHAFGESMLHLIQSASHTCCT